MPKMKTKSSVKARGTRVMSDADQSIVRKFMPYDR